MVILLDDLRLPPQNPQLALRMGLFLLSELEREQDMTKSHLPGDKLLIEMVSVVGARISLDRRISQLDLKVTQQSSSMYPLVWFSVNSSKFASLQHF